MSNRGWFVLGVLLIGTLSGCGPATGSVSGNVTIDGQPLDKGVISYSPAEGQSEPVTVEILNGKYATDKMVAGKKFVQISAPKVVGKRKEYEGPDAPLVELTEERLPPKYNSESTLTFEVKPGDNDKDWAVESVRGR